MCVCKGIGDSVFVAVCVQLQIREGDSEYADADVFSRGCEAVSGCRCVRGKQEGSLSGRVFR